VLRVIGRRVDGSARLEHECVEPGFREFLGCPASGDAGAHHDGVVGRLSQSHCPDPPRLTGAHGS
jgi:hypothetical protein